MRRVDLSIEAWPLIVPFAITGHIFTEVHLLVVRISEDGAQGRGEATGVYYNNETAESMLSQVESVRVALEQGAGRTDLLRLLPSGGARNAVDCALWDFEAKQSGKRVWELIGITPTPVTTANTVGLDNAILMAQQAKTLVSPVIKVKLDGEKPLDRIRAVCEARPDARVVVDVNQGWTFEQLVQLIPRLSELGIKMIEQPLPRGADAQLENLESEIMICADESCLDLSDFDQASRRYQMINIKLDKAGGLTTALELAGRAQAAGLKLMVGNMLGTSLAMSAAFVIAQFCEFVDLDGPLFLTGDRSHAMSYAGGIVSEPLSKLWG